MKTPNLVRQILLLAHPVGCYYWSSDATSPATLFGGTWERIENRFVFAAGTGYAVESTGGNATVTVPVARHNHKLYYNDSSASAQATSRNVIVSSAITYTNLYRDIIGGVEPEGTSPNNVSIMPPYIVAYCWRRTA